MLSHSDLKKGIKIILDGKPYEILKISFLKKARREVIVQTKIKDLITGSVFSRNFHQGETFEIAEIGRIKAKFLYSHRGKFFFCEQENPSRRFDLTEKQIGQSSQFLKQNQIVEALKFGEKIINISLPIKIQLKVIAAPPAVRGERAQPGTKQVILETGTKINVPLFIKEGDIVEINTETGEYVRRI